MRQLRRSHDVRQELGGASHNAAVVKTEKHASPETGERRRSVLVWAKRGLGAGDEEVGGVGCRCSGNEALGGW